MKKIINFFMENNLTAPAIILGLAVIIFSFNVKSSANNFANKSDNITVTGSSERLVVSDTGKMTLTINSKLMGTGARTQGEKNIQNNLRVLKSYLNKNGIEESSMIENPSTYFPICALSNQGYENCSLGEVGANVTQSVVINLDDVKKIESISKKINSDLASINVTQSVEYYYNNLKNIRADMLSEATKNAKERAVSVASAGGASIGSITSLSSGVFQVTTQNSVAYDDYGAYDTTSIDKKITATVKANFSIK
jgi:hypothetical protein